MIRANLQSCLCVIGLSLAVLSGAVSGEDRRAVLLDDTEALLQEARQHILKDAEQRERQALEESRQQLEKSAGNAASSSDSELARRAEIEAERQRLLALVTRWSREDIAYLDQLSAAELNRAMASAANIARYFGLNVPRLRKLYRLGKDTILRGQFITPDNIPPDQDESYERYFRRLFIFAHEQEKELAEFRRRNQEYRVRLFKKVALAYLRALLASGEPFPACDVSQRGTELRFEGQTLHSAACPDPVVEQLRSYVQAVQQLASAEADIFAAEAEKVLAEQTLIADIAAGVPLMGDAIDFYSLYSGEDLAGKCLSRFSYGMTAVFAAIPFVPASWMDQVMRRSGDLVTSAAVSLSGSVSGLLRRTPGAEQSIARLMRLSGEYAEWGAAMTQAAANRVGLTPERMDKAIDAMSALLTTEISATRKGIQIKPGVVSGGKLTASGAARLNRELSAGEIVHANLRIAEEGQVVFRNLPRDLRERMKHTSKRIMRANLEALPQGRRHVIDVSNMLPEHLEAFEKLARQQDAILAFRAVNGDATNLIRANYATKWMDVKPKSADWGPHRGFLPFDQNFSKIMSPDKLKSASPKALTEATEKAAKYSRMAEDCIAKPNCFKVDLVLPDGNSVHIWKNGDIEVPVVRNRQGQFLDNDSGKVLDIDEAATRPMEVMAGRNADGEIVPLTADYDLLAMGTRSDARAPKYSDETGYISAEEEALVEQINAAGKQAGYSGGNLSHHGPENQFYKSPGALAEDPVMTMVDPQKGLISIPRCDADCMSRWCKTSGQCGALPICRPGREAPPCIPIDPDRLLKDYFHDARMRGYTNLRPNSVWGWGEVNGLSGWTPKVLLEKTGDDPAKWAFGQYRAGWGVVDAARMALNEQSKHLWRNAVRATGYLFSCPGQAQ